jgi:hypothetical protein
MKSVLLTAGALVAFAIGSAQAASIIGTNSVGAITTISGLPKLALGDVLTNSGTSFGGSQTGNFIGNVIPGSAMADTSLTATAGSAYSWTSSVGSFAGTVTGAPILTVNNPLSRDLSVFVLGTFTPAGTLAGFSPGAMSETISYTETDTVGGGASFSFSATIASPPSAPPLIPEPASLSIVGVGLVGFGLARRKRS